MKMVKKILLGLALAGTVLALAGCSMGDDKQMDKEGDKWDFTATIDHKMIKKDKPYTVDKLFQRAWTQLGNRESVENIKTTITIISDSSVVKAKASTANLAEINATLDEKKQLTELPTGADTYYKIDSKGAENIAVVGFLFDLHKTKNTAGETVYDFILLGLRPTKTSGKDGYYDYYIERYFNVPENAMKTPTSLNGLWKDASTNCEELDGKASGKAYVEAAIAPSKFTKGENDDGLETLSFDVTVTQDNGKYKISFCGIEKVINTTTRGTAEEDKDGVLKGGAGVYANAPLGTIAYIHSKVDKENTKGLYEEVEE